MEQEDKKNNSFAERITGNTGYKQVTVVIRYRKIFILYHKLCKNE